MWKAGWPAMHSVIACYPMPGLQPVSNSSCCPCFQMMATMQWAAGKKTMPATMRGCGGQVGQQGVVMQARQHGRGHQAPQRLPSP